MRTFAIVVVMILGVVGALGQETPWLTDTERARFEELRPLNAVRSVIRQICKRQVLVAVALRDLDHISRCERRLVSGSSQPAEKRGDFTCAGQF